MAGAYAVSVRALVAVLREIAIQIDELQRELERSFRSHPDAEIYLSLPGLGDCVLILAPRASKKMLASTSIASATSLETSEYTST